MCCIDVTLMRRGGLRNGLKHYFHSYGLPESPLGYPLLLWSRQNLNTRSLINSFHSQRVKDVQNTSNPTKHDLERNP